MSLGQRIKEERIKKGLKQSDLAFHCGVSTAMISFIESGEKIPSIALIKAISQKLEVSIDYLVGNE